MDREPVIQEKQVHTELLDTALNILEFRISTSTKSEYIEMKEREHYLVTKFKGKMLERNSVPYLNGITGILGETLFLRSLRNYIPIEISTGNEDFEEGIDFLISKDLYPIDVTMNPNVLAEKIIPCRCPTLLLPLHRNQGVIFPDNNYPAYIINYLKTGTLAKKYLKDLLYLNNQIYFEIGHTLSGHGTEEYTKNAQSNNESNLGVILNLLSSILKQFHKKITLLL